jgi:hypothetical protein
MRLAAPRRGRVRSSVLPMEEAKTQFIERTLKVWQRRTSRVLTREDARQIAENVTGFFKILMEWGEAERGTCAKSKALTQDPELIAPGRLSE